MNAVLQGDNGLSQTRNLQEESHHLLLFQKEIGTRPRGLDECGGEMGIINAMANPSPPAFPVLPESRYLWTLLFLKNINKSKAGLRQIDKVHIHSAS